MTMDKITTAEFAAACRVQSATIRRAFCVAGHYMNVRPLKLVNGRLLWPRVAVDQILSGVDASLPDGRRDVAGCGK